MLTMHENPSKGGQCQNTFTPRFVQDSNALLDTVEESAGPCALVITSQGKFFSNGHDLRWLAAHSEPSKSEAFAEAVLFLNAYYNFLARCMMLTVPTVAAINGHAFAGGCLLALA